MKLLWKRVLYAYFSRRHKVIGITFTRPGYTSAEPIFEVRLFGVFFRVSAFGSTCFSYAGFEDVRKVWLWETRNNAGSIYYWRGFLPEVINAAAAIRYKDKP